MLNLCVYLICILHLIKIRTFHKKIDSYLENINSQDVLKGLNLTKFFEILHSNTTPCKDSSDQLKIAFKDRLQSHLRMHEDSCVLFTSCG